MTLFPHELLAAVSSLKNATTTGSLNNAPTVGSLNNAPAVALNLQTFTSEATNWLMALAAGSGALMFAYHHFMRMWSGGDPSVDAHHAQAARKVLIGTVMIVAASGIAHFVATLFG